MNAPSEDIKDILESSQNGIGTFGTDLFVSKEPDSPDACVTIYDTGGLAPMDMFEYRYPTVQVRVRGSRGGYLAGYAKAEEVMDALHALHGETWNGTKYIGIWATSDIIHMGYDDNQRPIFTINFRIHRSP